MLGRKMNNHQCRFCGKKLDNSFVDLGLSPLANEYISKEHMSRGQYFYPLNVKVCDECFLVQALVYQKPEDIFSDYKYLSSFSTSWLKHAKNYVDMIVQRLMLNENNMVYEIACNDGYLLQYFQPYKIPVCGIEPAANVAKICKEKGIDVEVEFWGKETAENIVVRHGKADLLIGNNVLAHVPNINSFVEGIKIALNVNGTATFEFPHLMKLMQYIQFDTIYHEHFSYLSLDTVTRVFEKNGLKIYDVDELDTHGGSLRIYVTHIDNKNYLISDNVREIICQEKEMGLDDIQVYRDFQEKVFGIKKTSLKLLGELKDSGAKIVAFGAAAKGNTFLNYCGIGKEYIDFVADSSTEKQGLYLPGNFIPIVEPGKIKEEKPDYIVFLAWNLCDEFAELLEYTRAWGCKFITFIPEPKVF